MMRCVLSDTGSNNEKQPGSNLGPTKPIETTKMNGSGDHALFLTVYFVRTL